MELCRRDGCYEEEYFEDGFCSSLCRQLALDEESTPLPPVPSLPREYCPTEPSAPAFGPGEKASNPKDVIGSSKLPLHLWPGTATSLGAIGLLNGALKYGRTNWRIAGVRLSIYADAILRHTLAMVEGEDVDPDDGVPHLAAILACAAIIADADAAGKLTDDRNYPGGYRSYVDRLTPHVARLKALHAGRSPRHYTIEDKDENT